MNAESPRRTFLTRLGEHWPLGGLMLLFAAKQMGFVFALGQPAAEPLALTCVCSSIALLAPAALLSGRRQLLVALALDALGTALMWGDLIYFRQMGDITSAAALSYIGQVGDEVSSVAALMRAGDLVLLADIAVIGAACCFVDAQRWLRRVSGVRVLTTFGVAAVVVFLLLALDPMRTRTLWRGHSVPLKRFGPVAFHARDLATVAAHRWGTRTASTAEVEEIRKVLAARRTHAAPPPDADDARGKNLIVIQVESLQRFAVGARVGGVPVAPNLEALANESVRFERSYHQTGAGVTSDADLLFNCSLYPIEGGSVYAQYADRDYRCLPTLFSEAGYSTAAFQGIRAEFWNAAAIYPKIGYQRFFSRKDYVVEELHGHGITDPSFLRQSLDKLAAMKEPYFAFLVTLTSHVPFTKGDPLPLGEYEDTLLGRYLEAVHYTDRALGDFVRGLRERGLLDRSVLVVYGDHHALPRSPELAKFVGIDPNDEAAWFQVQQQVGMMMRLPNAAHAGLRSGIAAEADLAPTLASLFGLARQSAPFFGRDLFADGVPQHAVFADGSATDGARIYRPPAVGRDRTLCLAADGSRELQVRDCDDLARAAEQELAASRAIVIDGLLEQLQLASAGAPESGTATE